MFLENSMHNHEEAGWVEVICGSMFSGRTKEPVRRLRRAQFAKQKIEIFKPFSDTRHDDTNIISHNATKIPSTPVEAAASILFLADGCDVVGIDEAQFFGDEIINVCSDLANRGVRVIVTGLDMNCKGDPFGPMPCLMVAVGYVTKVYAVCTRAGYLANHSFRKVPNDNQRTLDGSESYEPLSRAAPIRAKAKGEAQRTTDL